MAVVFVALPIALLLAAGAVAACFWAIRSGQYEDLETPAVRMLFDDQPLESSPGSAGARDPDRR